MTAAFSVNGVEQTVMDWLLDPENPAVRYATLTQLLGRSAQGKLAREARTSIMRAGVVPAILEQQQPEGYWGKPDSFYTAKYRGTVWQLMVLAEHFADGRDSQVRRACEFILSHSQDRTTGGFSMHSAKRIAGGLASEVIPCLTGNMVWSLIRLGLLDDPRVEQGIDWLTRYLRFDDGDSCPPPDWPYHRWDMCYGRHSCFMGVVKGLKALAEIPAEQRSKAVRGTIDSAVKFLLRHHVFRQSHNLARIAKPGWTRFGFPRMYQTDALEISYILSGLGVRDQRMRMALDLIQSKREPDGRWLLKDTFNDKFLVDVERKGRPSKWITLHALVTLSRLKARQPALSPNDASLSPTRAIL